MENPYYINPAIEALPSARGEERLRLCRRIAAVVGDPLALREILGIDPKEFENFYPDMLKPELTTSDAIDAFLNRYGDNENIAPAPPSPAPAAAPEEELIPLSPLDYDLNEIEPDFIEGETAPADNDPTASLLNGFLGKEPEKKEKKPLLSESLARAMIKNGNYKKALEIITDLSLNNPKKSIYFADQIRFLKKLILNQSKSARQ